MNMTDIKEGHESSFKIIWEQICKKLSIKIDIGIET